MITVGALVGAIAIVEVAARSQRNLHRLQIVLIDDPWKNRGSFARAVRDAYGADAPRAIAPERQNVAQADGFDSRDRATLRATPSRYCVASAEL